MITRSASGMCAKAAARSGPDTTSRFSHGVNFSASAFQFWTSDVGHTTSAGLPRAAGSVRSSEIHVSVWSVLPRPISSASRPESPLRSRKRIQ